MKIQSDTPRNRRQIILIVVVVIFVLNLVDEVGDAVRSGDWAPVAGQMVLLGLVGWIAWQSRDTIQRTREEYRRRFEENQDNVSMRDAAMFSLAWTREIYRSIPPDRKRLVKQAYLLIGLGLLVVLVQLGAASLLTVLIIAALVLAGVNLLVWVFATERGEKDRLRIQLETAREMQMSLMPVQDPLIDGLDVSGLCVPALNVGGDHFDYAWFNGDRRRFGVAVVDVAGKGMDAALTAVFTSGAFVSASRHETDLGAIMATLNAAIRSRNNRTRFVSFLLAAVDRERGELAFVNAGQSKPLLVRDGRVTVLESEGPHFPLGLVEDVAWITSRVPLAQGDVIVLHTDGLSEAMNAAREMYGEERVRTLLRDCASLDACDIVATLRAGVAEFAGAAERHDDLTVVAVKVSTVAAPSDI